MVCVIVGVIVGARLGYVLFYGDGYYLAHPLEILAFNKGGMSFHGGLVGALASGIVAARITRIPADACRTSGASRLPSGLFFGRCANFVNGELWGAPTDAAWGVVFGGRRRHDAASSLPALRGAARGRGHLHRLVRAVPSGAPARAERFWACSSCCTGAFRFSVELCASPMRSSGTCGADGSRWGSSSPSPRPRRRGGAHLRRETQACAGIARGLLRAGRRRGTPAVASPPRFHGKHDRKKPYMFVI